MQQLLYCSTSKDFLTFHTHENSFHRFQRSASTILFIFLFWKELLPHTQNKKEKYKKDYLTLKFFNVEFLNRCGSGAVVLLWDMTLEVISVNGDTKTLYLHSRSHLVQEVDSVRIISSVAHDILHKVKHDF